MINDKIHKMISEALKARDEIRLSTYRLLASAFNYERIAKQHELSEEEELVVVKREAKKRKDAMEAYEKAGDLKGAKERLDRETQELAILKVFLPEEISDEELQKIVKDAVSHTGLSGIQNMGKVMGAVMAEVKGRADGGRVSELVRKELSAD